MTKIELGKLYLVTIDGSEKIVRAVDGEVVANQPGLSHGFIHFAHPDTRPPMGISGVSWFEDNATRIYGNV